MKEVDRIKYTENIETTTPTTVSHIAITPMNVDEIIKLWIEDSNNERILVKRFDIASKEYIKNKNKKTVGSMSYTSGTGYTSLDSPSYVQTENLYLWLDNLYSIIDEMIKENPLCCVDDIYLTYAEIVDNPNDLENAKVIVFDKLNPIYDLEHPIRQALAATGRNERMALDIGGIYDMEIDDHTLIKTGKMLERIKQEKNMMAGRYIVLAEDVEQYTTYIYPHLTDKDGHFCQWTFHYSCPMFSGEVGAKVWQRDSEQPCEINYPIK